MAKERTSPPSPADPLPSGVVTFMFTDIVSSTEMKGQMRGETSGEREDAFHDQIKEPHEKIIKERLEARGGRIIEGTGDGYFIAFEDPEQAVVCAVEIQERLTSAAIPTPLGSLQVRVGVHSGRAKPRNTSYTSSAADKAARVQSKVAGGSVLISQETHGLVVGKITTLAFAEVGVFDLKGLGSFPLYQAFRKDHNPNDQIAEAYRQHLIERFGKLTLYSLSADQPIAVDLEQVFVKLTGIERRPEYPMLKGLWVPAEPATDITDAAFRYVRSKNPSIRQVTFESLESGQVIVSPPEAEALLAASVEVTLSISEALRAHPHLAIIGAPGAGKTTLLKWLALAYARRQVKERLELEEDRLPLFVVLRDFSRFLDNLEKREGLSSPLPPALLARHLQEYYAEQVSHLSLPANFFLHALATGKALVLLDGLDEVANSSKRARAAEFVAACVSQYAGNRFVFTSRPRGYETDCRPLLAPHCVECRVRDFDDDDIAAFSRNWYLAVTLAREGDNPTIRNKAEAAAKDLLQAVKQDRVHSLAFNPLLLSILALIHQRGVGLPQRRVELYDECTEFLLGYWDQVKAGEAARELSTLGGLTRKERRTLLEPIALWMHERGEQGTEVNRKDLEAQLAQQFADRFGDNGGRAQQRAQEFVAIIVERAGLLVERETDIFAFSHLTFQEYLAARALSDRSDFVEATLLHLHDPWWREVHLLEVAHLSSPNNRRSREDTAKLLGAIWKARSWLEDDLHRDLLFACHALCDVGPLGVEDTFRRDRVKALLSLWQDTKVQALRQRIEQLFNYAGSTPVGCILVDSLLPLAKSQVAPLRGRAAWALGRVGAAAATPLVLNCLLELSQDGNAEVRGPAAGALGRLGAAAATPLVQTRLLELSQDANNTVREHAASALGRLATAAATPLVQTRLLELSQDANNTVRENAASALGRLAVAAAAPAVLTRLLELTQDVNEDVGRQAAGALGNLGASAAIPAVLDRLLALAQDPSSTLRRRAARSLSRLGGAAATPAVLERLLALTQDASNVVRKRATRSLGQFGPTAATPAVLVRLSDLTQDATPAIRGEAAAALGRMGAAAATPAILDQLLALTEDANNPVRRRATRALGRLGGAAATPAVLNRLLALTQDSSPSIRRQATVSVGRLGASAATPLVLARLLELTQDANNPMREHAVITLGGFGPAAATPAVLDRLFALSQDCNPVVRGQAAVALGRVAIELKPPQAMVLTRLCQAQLNSEEYEFIGGALQSIGQFAFDTLHRLAAQRARLGPAKPKRRR